MRILTSILIGLCVIVPTHAQPAAEAATPGNYVQHRMDGSTIVVEGEGATARVSFVRPSIVRVEWSTPATRPDTSMAVIADKNPDVQSQIYETPDRVWIRSSDLTVAVQKEPVRIRVHDRSGEPLLAEAERNVAVTDTSRRLAFDLRPDTRFYGTGERAPFQLRGHAFDLKNTQHYGYAEAPSTLKINVPLLVSTAGYGLFIDNPYPSRLDVGASDSTRMTFAAPGGRLTYYVLAAPTVEGQLEQYTHLTGRQPMPPKWALGYLQSKMGYRTQSAARGAVDTLRQKNFPVDGLILDLYWFEHMGDLRWNRAAYPTPFAMMRDLQDRGIQTIAITETYITRPSRLFEPALDSSFVGRQPNGSPYVMPDWWSCEGGCDVALLDISDPAAQDWWWQQHPPFMGDAMAGLWTDLGEPEKHPMDMQHHLGAAPRVHNVYNLLWAQTIYENWRTWRPNQRTFNLTRSGSAGIQRYGTFLWSGDVARQWSAFQDQPALMLNAGLSGLAYYGSDLGGYVGDTKSPELYTRWMQHGALSPTMRPHGVDNIPTEPWRFGAEAERIVREAVHLRYRLMPYLYTLAWQNHRTGVPLTRPLFVADPDDPRLSDVDDTYLLGDALLVAPVWAEGARTRTIVLPEGTWIAYDTGRVWKGGQTVTVDAPLDRIPLFVNAGSIVPQRPVAPHTGAQPADTLALAVYPDSARSASFTLYEDDGTSMRYQAGAYATTPIHQRWRTNHDGAREVVLRVGAAAGAYDEQPDARTIHAAVHRMASPPNAVRVNGRAVPQRSGRAAVEQEGGWTYDADRGVLHVSFRGSVRDVHTVVAEDVALR